MTIFGTRESEKRGRTLVLPISRTATRLRIVFAVSLNPNEKKGHADVTNPRKSAGVHVTKTRLVATFLKIVKNQRTIFGNRKLREEKRRGRIQEMTDNCGKTITRQ